MSSQITVSVQAVPSAAAQWRELARRLDRLGFDSLLVPDHPGTAPAPFVALAAAAAVTERLRVGTYVVNAGAWEPLALAGEAATLDVVSGGRAILGMGAGHTPAEWRMRGLPYPDAAARVRRMTELTDVARRLLAGEEVTYKGDHVTVEAARLEEPSPLQDPIPLLVGGGNARLLAYAAAHADIVGLSGLGRTLPDGHRHETRWSREATEERLAIIAEAAAAAGRQPEIEALVQVVELTDDAEGAAQRLADRIEGLSPEEVLDAPFAWIGTAGEVAAQLQEHRERWGITRYVVREPAVDAAVEVRAAGSAALA